MKTLCALALVFVVAFISVPEARGADVAVAEKTVEVAPDVALRVRAIGENDANPPVLMLTGGPGFAGEQLFATAQGLGGTREVILPDQRGTGASNNGPLVIDPGAYNFAQAVSDLETLRKTMGVERWAIAGHSWGGLLAMLYASEHPERVESMALIAPAGIESSFWAEYQNNIFNNLTDRERQAMGDVPLPKAQTPEEITRYIIAANRAMAPAMIANEDASEALQAEMTTENFNPTVSLSMQQELTNYDLREDLGGFESRVLVIQGDADPIGRTAADRIVETLPNAELRVIENCGHWPMLEATNELNEILEGFFGGE